MRELRNPFVDQPGYNCFGCNPGNPLGLRMTFFEKEDQVLSFWEPKDEYQGFSGVLHGGIQATLMDELASWFVFVKLRTSGMTEGMRLSYTHPVYTTGGKLTLTAELAEQRKRRAEILVRLYQGEAQPPRSEGICTYALFSEPLARKKLHYPGYEAFLT
ncbi:MAG: PaaI family thioesterase [Spirochaetaceae bacterium]